MGMSERNDLKKYGIVKGRLQINLRCKGEGGGGQGGAGVRNTRSFRYPIYKKRDIKEGS